MILQSQQTLCHERDFLYSKTQQLIYMEEKILVSSICSGGVMAKPTLYNLVEWSLGPLQDIVFLDI